MTKSRFIYVASRTLLLLSILSAAADSESSPATTMYPMMDQFLAISSDTNATFNCSVAPGFVVVWEVGGTQISYSAQFTNFRNMGYTIQPANAESAFSTITISVRDLDKVSMIKCLPFMNLTRWCPGCSDLEPNYRVITFDSPNVPVDLTLQPSLMLQWSRPLNVPSQVPISYTIESNATDGSGMNFINITSETSFSVQFLEDMLQLTAGECVEFEFFVFATNDAGSGPLVRVMDTVPISFDVADIDKELRVERVDLQSDSADVEISFPSVKPCSDRFPLTNYTLNIDGVSYLSLSPHNATSEVPLTGLPQDSSLSLTIIACSDVTCRTSQPRIINTTDTQAVQVVFYKNDLYLHCTFADHSRAKGCTFKLVLKDSNITEEFRVARQDGDMHTVANNQREAYGSVFVMDWEENGMEGNLSFDITESVLKVPTVAEFTAQTGFVAQNDGDQGRDVGIVATAAPAAVVVAVVALSLIAISVMCLVIVKKSRPGKVKIIEHFDEDNNCVTYEFNLKGTEFMKTFKSTNCSSTGGRGLGTIESPFSSGDNSQHPPAFLRFNSEKPPSQEAGAESNPAEVPCELELDTKFVRLKFHQTAYQRMHSAPATGDTGQCCVLKISEELQKLLTPGEEDGLSDTEEAMPDLATPKRADGEKCSTVEETHQREDLAPPNTSETSTL